MIMQKVCRREGIEMHQVAIDDPVKCHWVEFYSKASLIPWPGLGHK